MNITISDPTPKPEMPVMWAVARYSESSQSWVLNTSHSDGESALHNHKAWPGSRLIKIDPTAPSFEPGRRRGRENPRRREKGEGMMDEAQTIAMAATGKECSCGKGQCVTCILAGEIRRRDADIIKLKAELAEARKDIDNAVRCAVLAMPEGWKWVRQYEYVGWATQASNMVYVARKTGPNGLREVSTPITGHTPEAIRRDLLALARLACIAEGAEP